MVTLPGSEPRSGNLTQEIRALLRYQVTILVAFWLVFAAPITCQHHGLLPLTVGNSYHMGHAMPDQTTNNDHSLRHHETASNITLNLFIVVLPGRLTFHLPEPKSEQVTFAWFIPQEWIAPPPDKPPRLSV